MNELEQVRQKYPEYKDWSDAELGEALKDKYYPDMPDNEYWKELGINPIAKEETKGWSGVGKDILQGVADLRHIPAGVAHLLSAAPGELKGLAEQTPLRAGQNLLAGLGNLGHDLLSIPSNIVEYGHKKDVIPEWVNAWKPQEFDYAKGVGLEGQQAGDKLLQGLPEFAATLAGAEAGQLGKLGRMAARSASFGTAAIANDENPITAALAVPVMELGGKTLSKGFDLTKQAANKITPSGYIASKARGLLSPEELATNVRATEGMNTDIGRVVGSPKIAHEFSNEILPSSTLSDEILNTTRSQLSDRASEIIDRTGGNIAGRDANTLAKSLLDASHKESQYIKNSLYNDVSDTAVKEGFQLELPAFNKALGRDVDALLNSPMMLHDETLRRAVNKLMGLNGEMPDIKGAKYIANRLESESQALKNPDAQSRALKGLYERSANAIRNDVKQQVNAKGSSKLKKELSKADDYYSQEYVQFLNKDIYKILEGGKEAETLVHDIIKPGKQLDKHTLIDKVTEILPEKQKGLLGAAYLNNAIEDGILVPNKVAVLYEKLGQRQKKSLFPDPKMREALSDFSKLKSMSQDSINAWFNPKTGAKNNAMLAKLTGTVKGGIKGGSAGSILGTMIGHPAVGAALGSALGGITSKAYNNYLAKIYTDPKFRVKVVDKINNISKTNKKPINALLPKQFVEIFKDVVAQQEASKERKNK
ncbi:MAG: YMGG-like Gly-zipper protein [Caudoviricetes sp.]|nr:MAG: YMGG-like Gly-zipper protein [Caudoviricetes sp.]